MKKKLTITKGLENQFVSILEELVIDLQKTEQAMLSEDVGLHESFIYQATIGMLEFAVRHVGIFARNNPEYSRLEKVLSQQFIDEIKDFRLHLMKYRISKLPMSFLGQLKFVNENGIFCEEQQNFMIDYFLDHYAPKQLSVDSVTDLELTDAWKQEQLQHSLLQQMTQLSINANFEHPRREELKLALGQLTSYLVATTIYTSKTLISMMDLSWKTIALDYRCLQPLEKQISEKIIKSYSIHNLIKLHSLANGLFLKSSVIEKIEAQVASVLLDDSMRENIYNRPYIVKKYIGPFTMNRKKTSRRQVEDALKVIDRFYEPLCTPESEQRATLLSVLYKLEVLTRKADSPLHDLHE